jgi:hypothetical protein
MMVKESLDLGMDSMKLASGLFCVMGGAL